MKKESNNDNRDRLRAENEEKKKKIEAEFGAGYWGKSEETELPPEIESQFLDHIMAFENGWKDAKQITLYEFLGKPTYRKLEELNEEEIHDELNLLYELMEEHQICLDTICEVSEQEIYRFIIEELLFKEKDDMHIPGMITHYTYEEFHPNHAYDIENYSTEFMISYLEKENDHYTTHLSSEATKKAWHMHFREAFSSFDLKKFDITDLTFYLENKNGRVEFDCEFIAVVDGSAEKLLFNGKGTFQLVYQWDFWYVDSVEFPPNQKI